MLIVEPLFDTHEIMNLHNLNDVHHIRCPEIQNLKSVCCLYNFIKCDEIDENLTAWLNSLQS